MLVGTRQLTLGPTVPWICVVGFANGSSLLMSRDFTESNIPLGNWKRPPLSLGEALRHLVVCLPADIFVLTFSPLGGAPGTETRGCSLLFFLWS